MSRDPIDIFLNELGEARSAGVFQDTTAETAFPWQARQSSVGLRGLRWLRVALPLAVAATLAFAFVGSSFRRSVNPADSGTKSVSTSLSNALVANGQSDPNDCNGDGVVNGEDIECFISHHSAENRASALQTEAFTRRLLGI